MVFDSQFFVNFFIFFVKNICRGKFSRTYLHSQTTGKKGSLAQLVQSICLTSRGSGVRIPQLPRIQKGARNSAFCCLDPLPAWRPLTSLQSNSYFISNFTSPWIFGTREVKPNHSPPPSAPPWRPATVTFSK